MLPNQRTFSNSIVSIACLLFLVLVAGCGTRGPDSSLVGAPVDVDRLNWEQDIQRINSGELKLPERLDYRLGPGDVISLTLVGRPDILGVDKEGKPFALEITENPGIVLPYVGSIRAHGKTPEQMQKEIQDAYRSIVRDPIVILTVDKYFYNQVSIIGSVNLPGRYKLDVGDTILDGIFKAGGLTFGGVGRTLPPARVLKLYREKVGQEQRYNLPPEELLLLFQDEDGFITTREELTIPLEEFIFGGDLSYNIPLQPNDVLFIPPAGTVSVHGPFKNPRVVFLGPGLRTLVQVMTECGGLRFKAASRVEVVRNNADGSTTSFYMDARKIRERKEPDFILEDNDQVFAFNHPVRSTLDVVGSIFRGASSAGVNATYSPVP
ncbi:MAG: polysaccharide biosynthesis/export family protein [Sumerlaeia bacterium]